MELSPSQLNSIKIEPVGTYLFPVEKEAVGSIDFDDDLSVQVFPPYQGKIIKTLVELGDKVQKGQPLYTIDSPDLIQAESTLIGAAADFRTDQQRTGARQGSLHNQCGVPQRELEQATSDQQTAEGALKAARDAVRVFGKSEAEIDQIDRLAQDRSRTGRAQSNFRPDHIVRTRQPGLLVQPGNRAGALYGRRRFDQMDAGECPRKRHSAFSSRATGSRSR